MALLHITTSGQHDRSRVVRALLERGWRDSSVSITKERMLDLFCGAVYKSSRFTVIVIISPGLFYLTGGTAVSDASTVTAEYFMDNLLAYNEC